MEMQRCPICYTAPSVAVKQVGSIELWVAGCDVHFKDAAAQTTYPAVVSEWNALVAQLPVCR